MFKKVDVKDLKNKTLYKVLHDNISFAGSMPFVYHVGKATESENFDIIKEGFDKLNYPDLRIKDSLKTEILSANKI